MNHWLSRVALMAGVAVPALSFAGSARADGCKNIHAEIDLTNGTITGNFGLNGTVVFTADSSGTPPSTAPASASVFSGVLEITTRRGTLRLRETGLFSSRKGNDAGPVLVSWGDGLCGTGFYRDVSGGDLFFTGRTVDGGLLVEVAGEICRQ